MILQRRRTAGIRLVHGETQVHVDPGPGALVFSNWAGLSPMRLDGLVVSHCHPDHYGDAEVFIEAMTQGTHERRGVLAAPGSVLRGDGGCGPSISSYHQGLVPEVESLKPGSRFDVAELRFEAVRAMHSDSETVGVRIEAPEAGALGYTSDTAYFDGISEQYGGLRLLILCTMWPRGNPLEMHLSTDDALRILEEAKPGCAVLTHFGMRMINAGPDGEAAYLEGETGIPVVAAKDGLKASMGEEIVFSGPRKRDEPRTVEA